MSQIVAHNVKGHTYYALESAYWKKGVGPRRRYIAYLGKNVKAYGLPSSTIRKGRNWTPGEQTKLFEIAEYRNRQTLLTATPQVEEKITQQKKRGRGRPRKYAKGRTKTGRAKYKEYKRTRLTGIEKRQLRNQVIRAARDQSGQRYADALADQSIEDEIDPGITYQENKKILFEKYGLDPRTEKEIEEEGEEREKAYYGEAAYTPRKKFKARF